MKKEGIPSSPIMVKKLHNKKNAHYDAKTVGRDEIKMKKKILNPLYGEFFLFRLRIIFDIGCWSIIGYEPVNRITKTNFLIIS